MTEFSKINPSRRRRLGYHLGGLTHVPHEKVHGAPPDFMLVSELGGFLSLETLRQGLGPLLLPLLFLRSVFIFFQTLVHALAQERHEARQIRCLRGFQRVVVAQPIVSADYRNGNAESHQNKVHQEPGNPAVPVNERVNPREPRMRNRASQDSARRSKRELFPRNRRLGQPRTKILHFGRNRLRTGWRKFGPRNLHGNRAILSRVVVVYPLQNEMMNLANVSLHNLIGWIRNQILQVVRRLPEILGFRLILERFPRQRHAHFDDLAGFASILDTPFPHSLPGQTPKKIPSRGSRGGVYT